jgi:tight adherence protein C
MTIVLLLAVFCFVAAALTLVQQLAMRREIRASLDRAAGIAATVPAQGPVIRGRRLPLVGQFARLALAVRPGARRDDVALRLAGAGLARRVSPDGFLAVQGALLVLSAFVAVASLAGGLGAGGVVLGLIGACVALVLPDRVLAARTSRRAAAILAELPGALDLLAVSVEAGLAFDAALARIADAVEGPLGEEFRLLLTEIRVGETRATALNRLAERVGVADVATFARALARADQLGTSVAQTLRVQATDARARRQLSAEEQAGKAPVKLLFPTIVFIFPALFVVVLGPAVLSFSQLLK